MLLTVTSFLGHFHPVLVHVPIGMLLLASVFYVLSFRERYRALEQATAIALLLGLFSAMGSCVSGYLLSKSGDYESDLVRTHQWLGISVAVIAGVSYYLYTKNIVWVKWSIGVLTILLFLTGHTGGSLTHGADYLFNTSNLSDATTSRPALVNVQEALAYKDLVQPLLEEKCYSCHNANKQKGQLRLDGPEWILQGGKHGVIVSAGHSDESELIKRLLLPTQDEKHMPPKSKAPLTEKEIALLHWWIQSGLSFDKMVKDLAQTDKDQQLLLGLQNAAPKDLSANPFLPEEPVEPADAAVIKKLSDRGAVILPVAKGTNYLMANFVTVVGLKKSDFQLLEQLKKQLVWLKLAGQPVDDDMVASLAICAALTKIDLSGSMVTNQGLAHLGSLQQLRSLNVTGTSITEKGLMELKDLKQLQSIYSYQSKVDKAAYAALKKVFPKVLVDTGGYTVPLLASDTIVVKMEK